MATIDYNGMELEEVTEPQIFDPPKRMMVWDNSANIKTAIVAAILPGVGFPVTTIDKDGIIQAFYLHCAEIHELPKPRRATNRELARWLAQGNGEVWHGWHGIMSTYFDYDMSKADSPVKDEGDTIIKVRKWSDNEWHEPTVEYLGIDGRDYNFNKKYKGE